MSSNSCSDEYWQTHQDEIKPYTRNTITRLDSMYQELEDIRAKGYAMDREENELGISCIAAPVFDIQNRVPYAVSISLPTVKLSSVGEDFLVKPLLATVAGISRELGFHA